MSLSTEPTSPQQHLRRAAQLGSMSSLAPPDRFLLGRHGERLHSRSSGASLDFLDYREYAPGDDPRAVDWGVYARSDRLAVRRFREEIRPRLDLFLDASASMAAPVPEKGLAALMLAVALSHAARNAGYADQLWQLDERPRQRLLDEYLSAAEPLGQLCAKGPTPLALRSLPKLPPGGVRMLISDLLWEEPPSATLAAMAGPGCPVVVLQVLCEEERLGPAPGTWLLEDAETGLLREYHADQDTRLAYQRRLRALQDVWAAETRRHGGVFLALEAEQVLESVFPRPLLATGLLLAAGVQP